MFTSQRVEPLAGVLADDDQLVEAERLLQFAKNDSTQATLILAHIYEQTERIPEATDLLAELVRDRSDTAAMRSLARLHRDAGRDNEAEELLRNAIRLHDHTAARDLANILAVSGRSKEAAQVLIDSAATGDIDSIIDLCRHYADRRNVFHLRRWYGELTRLGGNSAEIYLQLSALEREGLT